MKSRLASLIFLFSLSQLPFQLLFAAPHEIVFHENQGTVEFIAKGRPSALTIRGKGVGPQGSISDHQKSFLGTLSFDLSSLKTGIETRDHHMKEKYLEVEKFPKAELTFIKIGISPQVLESKDLSATSASFEGRLRLHGVEKPVAGVVDFSKKDQNIKIQAQFKIQLTDFEITIPSFAGITIANEVEVNVESTLKSLESQI